MCSQFYVLSRNKKRIKFSSDIHQRCKITVYNIGVCQFTGYTFPFPFRWCNVKIMFLIVSDLHYCLILLAWFKDSNFNVFYMPGFYLHLKLYFEFTHRSCA